MNLKFPTLLYFCSVLRILSMFALRPSSYISNLLNSFVSLKNCFRCSFIFLVSDVFLLSAFLQNLFLCQDHDCVIHYYLEPFPTLIGQNILKDSNYCFNSLLIRQRFKDLKHLISGNGLPKLQGWHLWVTWTVTTESEKNMYF